MGILRAVSQRATHDPQGLAGSLARAARAEAGDASSHESGARAARDRGDRSATESQIVRRAPRRGGIRPPLSSPDLVAGLEQSTVPLSPPSLRAGPSVAAWSGDRQASLHPLAAAVVPPSPRDFERLFREYRRYVASIGNRILGHGNGVDDLVQEVFLVIYQEFHKLRELSSIKAWLATITTRLAWRQLGRPWLHPSVSIASADELSPLESPGPSPEQHADLAALLGRLEAMPLELRAPWLLRFIDGETLPRIAQICSCSQSTVQRRLRDASTLLTGPAERR